MYTDITKFKIQALRFHQKLALHKTKEKCLSGLRTNLASSHLSNCVNSLRK